MVIIRLLCAVPDSVWVIVGAVVYARGLCELLDRSPRQ